MQEYYLVIVEKKEELKVFECVWMCLEEREREREREREKQPRKLPKIFFFYKMRGLKSFIVEF